MQTISNGEFATLMSLTRSLKLLLFNLINVATPSWMAINGQKIDCFPQELAVQVL